MNLLFPRVCAVCGQMVGMQGDFVCYECLDKLSLVKQPACKKCGKEIISEPAEYCPDCSRYPKSFESGMALLNYNEVTRKSMAEIKYKNRREYLDFYAEAMGVRFEKRVQRIQPEMLVPVPVHSSRKRKRGFNQAEELALRLGRRWQLPVCSDMLVRIRKTDPQKELTPTERLKNLQDAFALKQPGKRWNGTLPQTILLIDDIYTTGSTVEACTRVVKEAGIERVHVMVICIGSGVA